MDLSALEWRLADMQPDSLQTEVVGVGWKVGSRIKPWMLTNTDLLFFKCFFFNVDCFKSLSWIYYSIISVLCFDFFGHKACGTLSSLTRDWTHIPCIGRWSVNLWTTREVPNLLLIHCLKQFRGCRETAAPRVDLGKIIQKWGLLWWLRW